ncbi:MAG: dCTP deaminase [Nanoarchaeota archaeon]|nr:dCTP deaminase [Nanoarchaeota archaeon]MBU1854617.1 dCTP deaminase [Nanoarchaeota archaeon]
MAILTKKEIEKAIKEKKVRIEPYNKENIGSASIDLTLDRKFRYFKQEVNEIEITEEVNFEDYTEFIETEQYLLYPKEFVLGITKEKITLSKNLCGWLQGRSRFARLGFSIHITASFLQPGISNKQVLEIFNASNKPLMLKAGTKVCQLIIQECKGEAKYNGIFKQQEL